MMILHIKLHPSDAHAPGPRKPLASMPPDVLDYERPSFFLNFLRSSDEGTRSFLRIPFIWCQSFIRKPQENIYSSALSRCMLPTPAKPVLLCAKDPKHNPMDFYNLTSATCFANFESKRGFYCNHMVYNEKTTSKTIRQFFSMKIGIFPDRPRFASFKNAVDKI